MATKTLTTEDLQEGIAALAETARSQAVQDILIDLRDILPKSPEHERAGLVAAAEFIKANYH